MKKILILLITLGLMVGCSDDATNGPVTIVPPHGGGSNPVLEDTLTTLYEFANLPADESIAKLEFFSDDSLKVTLADNSMLNFTVELIEEGEETEASLQMNTICPVTGGTGTVSYYDLEVLDDQDDEVAFLETILWEGTCNGQLTSCTVLVEYPSAADASIDNWTQVYIQELSVGGCSEIQNALETLINNEFAL